MRALKGRLDRSLTAQAVVIFPLGVGIAALFRRDEHPVWWVIQGAFYSAIAITFVAMQRRRAARAAGTGPRTVAELQRKIRHREVPEQPEERATMRRLVAEQLGRMERGGRWLPYWLGLMGLIAVGMLALGAVNGSLVFPLLFAVGVIGFCSWALWMRRRTLDRYRHMRSALHS
ncbi:hypothetical protein GCM10010377_44750 [Streptomyces viridiviolaceus]|uniref:Transmembrane protein n=1 Tax=Streptomyces viridiviolaceus TaxID=68282 RepID=A0ABW2EGR4_9ACTN|nr:hypothetical protein [Streptomyces viridiviolaceus]GHB48839.1 hypothetical protein GCM10010377_44750 [Streptomyces viridiviolaceus]